MLTNPTSNDHLFVYGTLLRDSAHPMAAFLRQHSTPVGPGWFPGRLYNLGWYPGAHYEPQSEGKVYGDIVKLTESQIVLAELDRYEGLDETPPEYSRVLVPVQTGSGALVCWTYLYRGPVSAGQLIPSGKYSL
ncbi:gamma-glutamylcyclotransferase family protein [Tellurirhabdus rosea]|uniref:gamma-glutamylcyclotransferase family protein n=1 Tax=Tellurirhabdus rosea TaxID=2674997 RepID=UPI0022598EF6|nr:gamma-glutamylcyclotransferase family protein [Tellurirhabdus rosea]